MIPKTIHYCWFGRGPKPESVKKCIASWKKHLPSYEVIEWNEDNFDVSSNLYCRQAYDSGKWAFASDYARLKIIYEHGGIYLDTDVEVIRPWDGLLSNNAFIGRQHGCQVNTGAGFGAVKGHPAIGRMLEDYDGIPFIKPDGEMDLLTCPHRNSAFLIEDGMELSDTFQMIDDLAIYPSEYFDPKDCWTGELKKTANTYSVHHADATWNPAEQGAARRRRYLKYKIQRGFQKLAHLPNKALLLLIGKEKYDSLKERMRRQ